MVINDGENGVSDGIGSGKGGEDYSAVAEYNGNPSTSIAIKLASGANALDTADGVRAKMDELDDFFPSGLE